MTNGRRKGSGAEIEVARALAEWWKPVEPEAKFKRTPLSGGWGEADTRGTFKVAGDICTTSRLFPFTVEVKRREGWSFGSFSAGKLCPLWAWWRQAIEQAAEEDRIPLLFARKNRMPWIVLAPETTLVPICQRAGVEVDLVFGRLKAGVDDGDIRPAMLMGEKFFGLAPTLFLPRAERRRLTSM